MNAPVRQRLAREHELLAAILPRLQDFLGDHRPIGSPPTAHRFALRPFGFRVQLGDDQEPVVYDPARHGDVALAMCTDPEHHPWRPWAANLITRPDVAVFSPHVSCHAGARGIVCWIDGHHFEPAAMALHVAVIQILRILAGEVYALEGFSLSEGAKVWFAAHRDQLPFARVPAGRWWQPDQVPPAAAVPAGSPRQVPTSALGIEFRGGR